MKHNSLPSTWQFWVIRLNAPMSTEIYIAAYPLLGSFPLSPALDTTGQYVLAQTTIWIEKIITCITGGLLALIEKLNAQAAFITTGLAIIIVVNNTSLSRITYSSHNVC